MFYFYFFLRYLFSAGTGHKKINGILQTRPAKIKAVKIQYIFGAKATDVFSRLAFFDTFFRPQEAEKLHTFNSLFLSVTCLYLSEELEKKISVKNVDKEG